MLFLKALLAAKMVDVEVISLFAVAVAVELMRDWNA